LWFSTEYARATSDSLTFATFDQQSPNALAFTLTNNGISGAGKNDTFSSALNPIWFHIDGDAPTTAAGTGMAGTSVSAYLWLSASTNTSAYTTQSGSLDQPFNNGTTITIQSQADYNLHNQNYLLVAYYELGDMVGTPNKRSSTEFNGSDVSYQSHYLNFSGASGGALGLAFSNITPRYKIRNNNGLVDTFTASGIGTFSTEFAPEPQTYTLLATSLLALVWKMRRKSVIVN
jgi:hypothetical protein